VRRHLLYSSAMTSMTFVVLFLVLGASGCGKISGTSSEAESNDPNYRVPDGSPAKILAFVKELEQRRPPSINPNVQFDHMVKTQRAIVRAGDKILAQSSDDKTLKEIVSKKLMGTILLATGGAGSPEKTLAEVERLRNDKRPVVADAANEFLIVARSLNLNSMSAVERTQLADEAVSRTREANFTDEKIGNVQFVADQFLKAGDTDTAASLYERLADSILESNAEPRTKAYVSQLRGQSNRIRLPRSKLELDGKLLNGDDFDWDSYRGKVVLVDFWATWCGPCLAELPNVQAAYNKYRKKGFDVVAVSLDTDRRALERFVRERSLPWAQIVDHAPRTKGAGQQTLSIRYNISSIPTAFLVDRDGKVVSMFARGDELLRLLNQLLESTE
jgi:thiol-disulfide isomerase/thioredoxin